MLVAALTALPARATGNITVIGLFGDRAAVLVIDGAQPETVRVGQTRAGVEVLAIQGDRVTLRVDDKRRVLQYGGEYYVGHGSGAQPRAILDMNAQGHFVTDGLVDGASVRFVVDTGATVVALPGAVAQRLGIDYHKGSVTETQTANGVVSAWRIELDSVKVGGIELQDVDAIVIEHGLTVALLGMSFLDRVAMRRDGATMVLTKRF